MVNGILDKVEDIKVVVVMPRRRENDKVLIEDVRQMMATETINWITKVAKK